MNGNTNFIDLRRLRMCLQYRDLGVVATIIGGTLIQKPRLRRRVTK